MKKKVLVAAAAAVAAMGSTTAQAATLAELASKVEASGWISGSYLYNLNGEDNVGRATDINSNSFTLNQAVLNLVTPAGEGFGGGVQLLAGNDAATIVNPSYGDGDDKFSLPEAYITYTSGAFGVKAGRYGTLAGYEVLSDAANPLLSRSLQFPAAEPYFHTGVRLSYAASDAATLYLGVNNSAVGGFSNDPDDQKTVELGAAVKLSDAVSLAAYDYYGVDGDIQTNFLDVVGSFTLTDSVSLGINFDWASFEDTLDVYGIAGYATVKLNDLLSATLRIENLDYDPDGGDKTSIQAATIALSYTPASDFRLIAEARIDSADEDIYVKNSGTTDTQPTIGVKGIYSFGL